MDALLVGQLGNTKKSIDAAVLDALMKQQRSERGPDVD
jgi:hypothetical protein